jgi:hypothetical protein
MDPFQKERSSHGYTKNWPKIFASRRYFNEDESWVEKQRPAVADDDTLKIFLRSFPGPVQSCEVQEMIDFCQGTSFRDISEGPLENQCTGAKAWLDDRELSSRNCRSYNRRLTARKLYVLLKQPRFGSDYFPNADRRLIYVKDLDPSYILALGATVSHHQVEFLRDAIWKHLAFQTSIRVTVPHMGYKIFRMELHLPYLALREFAVSIQEHLNQECNQKPQRKRTDISFLNLPRTSASKNNVYGIQEAQISLGICGCDHSQWTAYAFVDTAFNNDCLSNVETSEDEDEDDEDEDTDERI